MTTAARLQVVVDADISPLKKGLNDANRSVTGFGSTLGAVGGVVATGLAVAGGAIAAGLAVGIKAAGNLEQAVANISTIKPEIDNSQVFASLNELQTRVPQSADQLGQALYDIFSSVDVSAEQGLQLVEKFSKGAVGAGTDASTWGTAVMGVMNAYGSSLEDVDGIQDVFFNTINRGVVSGDELAASLGPVTQAAKSAGLSIQDLGAYIAASTKEGGPAAQNINNLNNFLQKITTTEAQQQIEALGIKTKTMTGEFRPTTEMLTDLKARLGDMTEAAQANALQEIFPDAQARQGALVLMSQLDLVKEATEENQRATGSAAAAYEKMSQTFNSQSKLAVNGLMSITTTIGGELLPVITPLISKFSQELPGAFAVAKTEGAAAGRQISDAWGTVKQVFGEGWSPDASIEPLAQAAGNAATKVKELRDFIGEASDKASQMGAWDSLQRGMQNLRDTAESIPKHLSEIAGSLDRLNGASGGATTKVDALAAGLNVASRGFEVWSLSMKIGVDTMVLVSQQAIKFLTVLSSVGQGVTALATGDMETFKTSFKTAGSTMIEMVADTAIWQQRTEENVRKGARAIGLNISEQTTLAQAVGSV
ncbi:MAG: phage tail tape measure protein, partial [Chloroflexota bacterium]